MIWCELFSEGMIQRLFGDMKGKAYCVIVIFRFHNLDFDIDFMGINHLPKNP